MAEQWMMYPSGDDEINDPSEACCLAAEYLIAEQVGSLHVENAQEFISDLVWIAEQLFHYVETLLQPYMTYINVDVYECSVTLTPITSPSEDTICIIAKIQPT